MDRLNKYTVTYDRYSKRLLRTTPNTLYIFGDNLVGIGTGGQAVIRGEPNVFGIATKILPLHPMYAYLYDHEEAHIMVMQHYYNKRFEELKEIAEQYNTVVFPSDGLGTGLAKLTENAPRILEYIDKKVSKLIMRDYTTHR